ncbi:unnamed protein product [Amaranthus hypochondriacus]
MHQLRLTQQHNKASNGRPWDIRTYQLKSNKTRAHRQHVSSNSRRKCVCSVGAPALSRCYATAAQPTAAGAFGLWRKEIGSKQFSSLLHPVAASSICCSSPIQLLFQPHTATTAAATGTLCVQQHQNGAFTKPSKIQF